MRSPRLSVLAALLVSASALLPARAGVDLVLGNGDKVTSTLDAGGEVETFRFTCPEGAVLSVKAKVAKGGPALRLRVLDVAQASLGESEGPSAVVAGKTAPTSGTYTVEISAADGASAGRFAVSVAWKSAKSFGASATLAAAGQDQLTFAADAGGTVTLSVKKAKKSAAMPALVSLTGPDGDVTIAPGASASVQIPATGAYTLTFADTGAVGGAVAAKIKVKPPAPSKRVVDLGNGGTPFGTVLDAARVIGPPGGVLDAPADGPISGASVSIPKGALASAVSVLIGGTTLIATPAPGFSAGPAVFFGPEGLTFGTGQARVTIPYDASFFPAGTANLRVYTRAADGDVTEVTGLTIDAATSTVSFLVSHFSTFQARRAFPLVERARFAYATPESRDDLGFSVAVDGDLAAAGARGLSPDPANNDAGAVLTLVRGAGGAWTAGPLVVAPVLDDSNGFGWSVAISGNTMIVGAPFTDVVDTQTRQCGSAFVYVRDVNGDWQFEARLLPPGTSTDLVGYGIGWAVAIDGDTAVVGAPRASNVQFTTGAAYVFVRSGTTWTFQAKLETDVLRASEALGGALALEGDNLVVGPSEDSNFSSIHVFRRSGTTWTQAGSIDSPDEIGSDRFGRSVSMSGDRIAVGAERGGATSDGTVLVYRDLGDAFPLVARIDIPSEATGTVSGRFGRAVAIRGDRLVVGTDADLIPPSPVPLSGTGQVFLYEFVSDAIGWVLAGQLRGAGADVNPPIRSSRFGAAVAFDGETILAGASEEDASLDIADAGAAYVFDTR